MKSENVYIGQAYGIISGQDIEGMDEAVTQREHFTPLDRLRPAPQTATVAIYLLGLPLLVSFHSQCGHWRLHVGFCHSL
jgi:hypothetical protein